MGLWNRLLPSREAADYMMGIRRETCLCGHANWIIGSAGELPQNSALVINNTLELVYGGKSKPLT